MSACGQMGVFQQPAIVEITKEYFDAGQKGRIGTRS
jgi:hypothetical protein